MSDSDAALGGKTRLVSDGVWEIFLPLPGKPTIVNVWLVDLGNDEYALIDTGTARENSRKAFQRAVREIGIEPEAITHLLATHHHPDHFGASGSLASDDVRIHLHPAERTTMNWMSEVTGEQMLTHVRRHGIPVPKDAKNAPKPASVWAEGYKPAATTDHELVDGEVLALGKRRFEVVHTPGHTEGHCCFHELESGMLFVGDHLLPKITPHIGVFAGGPQNPLGDFIASQEKIAARSDVTAVCPAHGGVFADHRHRAHQLIAHHEHRMREMRDYLRKREASAFEVAQHAFKWVFDGDPEVQRFNRGAAVMETIAHLHLLEARGDLHSADRNGIILFHP